MKTRVISSHHLLLGLVLAVCGTTAAIAQDTLSTGVSGCNGSSKHSIVRAKVFGMYSCASSAVAYSPWRKSVPRYCQAQASALVAIPKFAELKF